MVGLVGGLVIGVSAGGRFLGAWMTPWISPRNLILSALILLVLSYVGLGVNRTLTPSLALLSLPRVFTLPAKPGEPVTVG